MPTFTPNYNFYLPVVGADDDAWGGYLNSNWSETDTQIKANADAAAANATAIAAAEPFKVGAIYISVTGVNPATELGYGTWVAFGEGRVMVGVGSNGEATWTNGEERGSETHTLTEAELPAHTHDNGTLAGTTNTTGDHNHVVNGGGAFLKNTTAGADGTFNYGSGSAVLTGVQNNTNTTGNHSHSVTLSGALAPTGSGTAHNNVQPSIGVYFWQRTV